MAEKKESAEATVRTIRRVTRKKYSAEEKIRIVLEGLRGETSIAALCRREGIPSNLYYRWSKDFLEAGKQRLVGDTERQADTRQVPEMRAELDQLKQLVAELSLKNRVLKKACWARSRRGTSDAAVLSREAGDHPPGRALLLIVQMALAQPEKSARQLAWLFTDQEGYFVSESSVFRLLKRFDLVESPAFQLVTAADRFAQLTRRVNELWQTDFTYFKIQGWGWYYLSTVLDDYSRYILAWRLSPTMAATDVQETLEKALAKAKLDRVRVRHRPRLLSDNGPCYVSGELRRFLETQRMEHTRGAPYHPMTQGKIERYHRSMKNLIQLQNYAFPWDLEREIGRFLDYYNHQRYHESLDNVTPADVYFGRVKEVLSRREEIKRKTLEARRRQHTHSLMLAA